jgi:hypothetical protein
MFEHLEADVPAVVFRQQNVSDFGRPPKRPGGVKRPQEPEAGFLSRIGLGTDRGIAFAQL